MTRYYGNVSALRQPDSEKMDIGLTKNRTYQVDVPNWLTKVSEKRRERLKKTALAGHGPSAAKLGFIEIYKSKRNQKWSQAYNWFLLGAEMNDLASQYGLAFLLREGLGIRKDVKTATKLFKRAASNGHIPAMFSLGYCYSNGIGIAASKRKAFRWFVTAAQNGDAEACYNVAYFLEHGIGTKRNTVLAVKWYRKAAYQGDAPAMLNLANCYFEGRGIQINKRLAKYWYKRSAKLGDKQAIKYLAAYS